MIWIKHSSTKAAYKFTRVWKSYDRSSLTSIKANLRNYKSVKENFKNYFFSLLPLCHITKWPPFLPLQSLNIYISAVYLSFNTHWPSIWGQLPHSWFPYKSRLPLASGNGKKGLISLSLVKKITINIPIISPPGHFGQHTHICTFTHLLDPISTNPVDVMQGELENRCSQSDLQKPFNSFSLLDFPFYPFKSTYNGTQGCCKWRGLSAWVRREQLLEPREALSGRLVEWGKESSAFLHKWPPR